MDVVFHVREPELKLVDPRRSWSRRELEEHLARVEAKGDVDRRQGEQIGPERGPHVETRPPQIPCANRVHVPFHVGALHGGRLEAQKREDAHVRQEKKVREHVEEVRHQVMRPAESKSNRKDKRLINVKPDAQVRPVAHPRRVRVERTLVPRRLTAAVPIFDQLHLEPHSACRARLARRAAAAFELVLLDQSGLQNLFHGPGSHGRGPVQLDLVGDARDVHCRAEGHAPRLVSISRVPRSRVHARVHPPRVELVAGVTQAAAVGVDAVGRCGFRRRHAAAGRPRPHGGRPQQRKHVK
mmetsp:Transcript_3141/g.11248  ORF Transcript_3141/g.11248 Transcript_3141/m.11248 type:complete len:297 (+) Transcript_3141:2860-3750(+)